MRKFLINKNTIYYPIYIILSLIFIASAIGLCLIPINFHQNIHSIGWIIMAFIGIICQSGYNVMQERYIEKSNDHTILNKFLLMFWSKTIEIIFLILFCWLELLLGNSGHPINDFILSAKFFISNVKHFFLLEGFILAYLISFTLAVYLNSISTNYNMITVIISNPLTMLFFYIFHQFNNGIKYPLWIILLSLTFGICSVIMWLKGEKSNDYTSIN